MANFDSFIEKKKMRFDIGKKPSYFPFPRERGATRNQNYLHGEIFKNHPTFEPFRENYQQYSKWPCYEGRTKWHSPEKKIIFNKFQPAATSTPFRCRRIMNAEEDYSGKDRQRHEFEFIKPKEINKNILKGVKNNQQKYYKSDFDELMEKNHKSSKRSSCSANVSPLYCKDNIIQPGDETMNLINDFKSNQNGDRSLTGSQFEFDHTLFFDKKENDTNVSTLFMKHFESNILNFEEEENKKGSNRQKRKPSNYYDDDVFVEIQQNPKINSHNDPIKGDTTRLFEKIFKPKNNRKYFNIMDIDGTAENSPLLGYDDNISLSSFNY